MSTNFPSALDTFTNPNGSDSLNAAAVPHAEQHANANDAIEALQAKVGINGSAVATSLDYRISAAETGLDGKISSSEKGSANGVATLGFDGKVPSSQLPPLDYIPTSEKGAAGGVAGLDEAGKVPAAQLPSYVDDVLEYASLSGFPATGEAGKIYVALDGNKAYRWSGSTYIYITSGAVDSVAGKTGVVVLAKADVGLGSVDDTSDANKPVSTATQAALDTKAPLSHVGATGAAHGVVTTSVAGFMSAADKTKLDGVAVSANNYTHPSGDGNLHVPATGTTNNGKVLKAGATPGALVWGTLAKADVGLGSVDNTSDANKPISTATQTALNAKESTSNKGVANGYAGLDATGKIPAAQLPSYVDDVLEYVNLAGFPGTGETGKIYLALDTNKAYRWSGSTYIYITSGAVDSVAGKTGVVVLAKADVGLGSVDNTSDADKPVSTAQQSALDLKLNTSGGTITANSTDPALKITQTGSGDALRVEDASGDTTPFVVTAGGKVGVQTANPAATLEVTGQNNAIFYTHYENGYGIWSQYDYGATGYPTIQMAKAHGNKNAPTPVVRDDLLARYSALGYEGTAFIQSARMEMFVDGTPGTGSMPGRLTFSTTPSGYANPVERMRIDSAGRVGIGAVPGAGRRLLLGGDVTGATTSTITQLQGNFLSDVTAFGVVMRTLPSTQAASFTLNNLSHYQSTQGAFGAGSTVTNQYGFNADYSLIGATNNYGFYGNIPAGTGRWNFYANGTAANYFAGNVTANAAFNQTPTRSTVASGSTVTLTTGTNHLLYDQAETVAALTVTLPSASLTDGQVITIATRSAITALTVNGGTIYGAPTTLDAGGFCSFIYSSSGAAWFRKG